MLGLSEQPGGDPRHIGATSRDRVSACCRGLHTELYPPSPSMRTACALVALALAGLVPATAQATFPGANGRVAYYRADGPQPYDILAVNPYSGRVVNITNDPEYDVDPAWSPDGARIAFVRMNFLGDFARIWIMNADGSARRQLTDLPGGSLKPSWSPDGSRIVFLHDPDNDGAAEIYTMGADGSGVTPITATGTDHVAPKWSPDGERILFSGQETPDRSSDYDLYTIRPDGSELRRVAALPGDQLDPDWSPDGKRIVFATAFPNQTPYRTILHKLNAVGSGLVSLGASGDDPVWSPDGTRIAFRWWPEEPGTHDLAVIEADGTDFEFLDDDPTMNEGSPSWQRLPKSVRLCRDGGWRNYGDFFKNERRCVAFVEDTARRECEFIRAALGEQEFRERYGEGRHKRHAMRRCIAERSGEVPA
jgi:Tol biopolymer transport system component